MRRRLFMKLTAGVAACSALGGAALAQAEKLKQLQESPPFELTSQTGEKISTEDFAGRPMIVYFGYTFCPDVCPTTLFNITTALNTLKEQGVDTEDMAFLFVSVDPERDTLQDLAEYTANFQPSPIGVTGTPEEVRAVADSWRVNYEKEGDDPENYTISHTAYAFGLDREHRVVAYLWHIAPPAKLAESIAKLF